MRWAGTRDDGGGWWDGGPALGLASVALSAVGLEVNDIYKLSIDIRANIETAAELVGLASRGHGRQ